MKGKAGWALILVLAIAAGLRGWSVYEYTQSHPLSDAPTIDEASYDDWAVELAGGEWRGEEVFFQEPLYPYFLGVIYTVFGRDLLIVRLLQAALGVLTCWLVAKLGSRLGGDWAGVLAGLLIACLPSLVLLPCLLLKPNLHLPLFCASALLLTRPGPGGIMRWFAIGATGGLCALLRGNSLVLLPLFFFWSFSLRPRGLPSFVRCLSFLLGVSLFLGPVLWRNHEVGGVWALTTSGAGTNLYGGNNLENPRGVATELSFVRGIPTHEAGDWRREAELRTGTALDPGEVSRYWLGETMRSFIHRPLAHLEIFWNKLRATLGWYAVPDNHSLAWDARYVSALRLPLPAFGVLAALGLTGLLMCSLRLTGRQDLSGREEACRRAALLFVFYLVTIVLTVTSMRARMPLCVLLAPLAGAWLISLRKRPRLGGGVALCLCASFVAWPLWSAEERAQDQSERDYNLAIHQLRSGPPSPETRDLVVNLVALHPNTARIRILSAELQFAESLRLRGQEEEYTAIVVEGAALRALSEITMLDGIAPRTRMSAYRLAGWIYTTQRDWENAEASFRDARQFDGEDPDLAAAHAQALVGYAETSVSAEEREDLVLRARRILDVLRDGELPAEMRADLSKRLGSMESE
jgi:4-amino-4-deoxy-L-arabinose transferase-like glycosyltransferase